MGTIYKVLIANRGEIALRVMRTCKEMGIETVAVHSEADEDACFVHAADEAVCIGPAPSAQSYLVIEAVLDAARRTGANAIHPGYGFLSENAEFARACSEAGLIFIGPSAESIVTMGSKIASKQRMIEAGVPVIPGCVEEEGDTVETLAKKANDVGFPLLIKASAGGGGKGMRLVRAGGDLQSEIEAAKREALGAFGDAQLLVERYVERPRHIEIQVFGDTHGNTVHLGERECSIQRRHQKVIEEAPSVAVNADLREQMGQVAVLAAKAVNYVGAGTVEFVLDPEGNFYFLEMNTRLQVEHPVTEAVYGVDLVREQIRVADGAPLSWSQSDIRPNGAAVECRLYAEDPAAGFLPSIGTVLDWHLEPGPGLRIDTGVTTGSQVGIHYDPMLAKLITWGSDRAEANRRMVRTLRQLSVLGLTTNRRFMLDVLTHPDYVAGKLHTHFIDEHFGSTPASPPSRTQEVTHAIALACTLQSLRAKERKVLPRLVGGWRNNPVAPQAIEFVSGDDDTLRIEYWQRAHQRFDVSVDDTQYAVSVVRRDEQSITLSIDGVRRTYRIARDDLRCFVHSSLGTSTLLLQPRFPTREADTSSSRCVAPMPGKVLAVEVEAGQQVAPGDPVAVIEAMKMEHVVSASQDAVIEAVLVKVGQQVNADQAIVTFVDDEAGDD